MVLHYLKEVQKYPDQSKRRIAISLSIVVTGILVTVWFLFLAPWRKEPVNLGDYEYRAGDSTLPSPIESVGNAVSEAYSGASTYVKEVGGVLNFFR